MRFCAARADTAPGANARSLASGSLTSLGTSACSRIHALADGLVTSPRGLCPRAPSGAAPSDEGFTAAGL